MSRDEDRTIGGWMVPPVLVPLFFAGLALVYGWLRN
jgi:hypothetical protein